MGLSRRWLEIVDLLLDNNGINSNVGFLVMFSISTHDVPTTEKPRRWPLGMMCQGWTFLVSSHLSVDQETNAWLGTPAVVRGCQVSDAFFWHGFEMNCIEQRTISLARMQYCTNWLRIKEHIMYAETKNFYQHRLLAVSNIFLSFVETCNLIVSWLVFRPQSSVRDCHMWVC